jgi:hypothetical protein
LLEIIKEQPERNFFHSGFWVSNQW